MTHPDNEETKIVYGIVEPRVVSTLYEFYISGEIGAPEEYIHVFNQIRHAGEDDYVKIYLNSGGGDLFSAIQFLRVLSETRAVVTVSVEGMCCSAATLIFLAADRFEVTPHSVFMFHTYTSGVWGKGSDQFSQITHERKWSSALLGGVYENFLTKEEIKEVLDGKDLWMDIHEIVVRMEARIAKRIKDEESKET